MPRSEEDPLLEEDPRVRREDLSVEGTPLVPELRYRLLLALEEPVVRRDPNSFPLRLSEVARRFKVHPQTVRSLRDNTSVETERVDVPLLEKEQIGRRLLVREGRGWIEGEGFEAGPIPLPDGEYTVLTVDAGREGRGAEVEGGGVTRLVDPSPLLRSYIRSKGAPNPLRKGGWRWQLMGAEQGRECARIAMETPTLTVGQVRERLMERYPSLSVSETTVWRALRKSGLHLLRAQMKDPNAKRGEARRREHDSFVEEQEKGDGGEVGGRNAFFTDETGLSLNEVSTRAWGTRSSPATIEVEKGKTMRFTIFAGIGLVSQTRPREEWPPSSPLVVTQTEPRTNGMVFDDEEGWRWATTPPSFLLSWWIRPPSREGSALGRFLDGDDVSDPSSRFMLPSLPSGTSFSATSPPLLSSRPSEVWMERRYEEEANSLLFFASYGDATDGSTTRVVPVLALSSPLPPSTQFGSFPDEAVRVDLSDGREWARNGRAWTSLSSAALLRVRMRKSSLRPLRPGEAAGREIVDVLVPNSEARAFVEFSTEGLPHDQLVDLLWGNSIEHRQINSEGELDRVKEEDGTFSHSLSSMGTMRSRFAGLQSLFRSYLKMEGEDTDDRTDDRTDDDDLTGEGSRRTDVAGRTDDVVVPLPPPRHYFGARRKGGTMQSARGGRARFLQYLHHVTRDVDRDFGEEVRPSLTILADSAPDHGKVDLTKRKKSFLHEWVERALGVSGFVFLPVRQPEYNPAELLFSFVKTSIRRRATSHPSMVARGSLSVDEMTALIDSSFCEVTERMVRGWIAKGCYRTTGVRSLSHCDRRRQATASNPSFRSLAIRSLFHSVERRMSVDLLRRLTHEEEEEDPSLPSDTRPVLALRREAAQEAAASLPSSASRFLLRLSEEESPLSCAAWLLSLLPSNGERREKEGAIEDVRRLSDHLPPSPRKGLLSLLFEAETLSKNGMERASRGLGGDERIVSLLSSTPYSTPSPVDAQVVSILAKEAEEKRGTRIRRQAEEDLRKILFVSAGDGGGDLVERVDWKAVRRAMRRREERWRRECRGGDQCVVPTGEPFRGSRDGETGVSLRAEDIPPRFDVEKEIARWKRDVSTAEKEGTDPTERRWPGYPRKRRGEREEEGVRHETVMPQNANAIDFDVTKVVRKVWLEGEGGEPGSVVVEYETGEREEIPYLPEGERERDADYDRLFHRFLGENLDKLRVAEQRFDETRRKTASSSVSLPRRHLDGLRLKVTGSPPSTKSLRLDDRRRRVYPPSDVAFQDTFSDSARYGVQFGKELAWVGRERGEGALLVSSLQDLDRLGVTLHPHPLFLFLPLREAEDDSSLLVTEEEADPSSSRRLVGERKGRFYLAVRKEDAARMQREMAPDEGEDAVRLRLGLR